MELKFNKAKWLLTLVIFYFNLIKYIYVFKDRKHGSEEMQERAYQKKIEESYLLDIKQIATTEIISRRVYSKHRTQLVPLAKTSLLGRLNVLDRVLQALSFHGLADTVCPLAILSPQQPFSSYLLLLLRLKIFQMRVTM